MPRGPMPFHLTAANSIDVPTMYQKAHHEFGQAKFGGEKGLKILKLPYKKATPADQGLSMLLLLPDDVAGLPDLETELTSDNLTKWTSDLKTAEVMVWLPKFKLTSQFGLNDTLSSLGMPLAFDPDKADFSGIDGQHDLYLSAVVHKAYVDVYEEGTEAAAATGVVVGALAMRVNPLEFRADHPFLFLIRDEATGCVLFMGRVTDPH